MPFKLQKLTRWKHNEDQSNCLVGAMSPMIAVKEIWNHIRPSGSEVTVTAIYRLWHTDAEVNTFWEYGNSTPVAADTLVAVLNFSAFMIIADIGHNIIPISLKLSTNEPLSLFEGYTQYRWIKTADIQDYENAISSIDLETLRSECQNELGLTTNLRRHV